MLLIALALCTLESAAFVVRSTVSSPLVLLKAKADEDEAQTTDPVTKGAWYAVETFGKLFGNKGSASSSKQEEEEEGEAPGASYSMDNPPQSMQETMERIKADNDREYFLSGTIDKLIYDENCEFADPFVSFKGRDRFIENLENLGSFITEYSAKPLSYTQQENAVETKFMVKLQLNLPWKPVLAWPWGVRCEIDPSTNLILLHKESWDVEAIEGVKQIFRKPTTSVK